MANEENLIPNSKRTPSELREITTKGGIASGKARRRKRSMKQAMEMLLNLPANTQADWNMLIEMGVDVSELNEEDVTNLLIVNASLLKQAKEGDVASVKELRNIIQDDLYQKEKLKIEKEKLKLEKQKQEPVRLEEKPYSGIPANMVAPSFSSVLFDIENRGHSEYVFPGGRGSTKSSFVGLEIVDLIKKNENIHACVLRQVADTLRTSVYQQIRWAITALNLDDEFNCTVSPLEITHVKTGQKIYFRGADDPNKIKSIKVPFGYIGVVWFEELDQFQGEESVRKIEQSVIRGGDIAYKFKSFNPPKSAQNWANKYIKVPRSDRLVVESTYLTVPQKWLGKPFIDDAEFLKETNPTAYENEYLGVANGTGGNVFDNVTIREITDEEIKDYDRIYRGVDWGWYPDIFAYSSMTYIASQHKLIIFDEYTCNKKSNEDTANELKRRGITANDLIICDSAENKSIADYRAYGLLARPAEKGAGSVEYSMKWLQSLNEIVIDNKRCPNTAEEFLNYEYERDKEGNVISGYPDKNNHSIDYVRYAMNRVWKRRGE
ncbi:MAG: PBSX family phage terminase large subunit [Acutalibacteraceae bacterium]